MPYGRSHARDRILPLYGEERDRGDLRD